MNIERLLTNLCSNDLPQSKRFYTALFSFNVAFESDWFVNLVSEGNQLEIGIIADDHDIVPKSVKGQAAGVYLTFVVKDIEELFEKAKSNDFKVVQAPELTCYGQKRMLLQAPEGTVCDVSSVA